MVKPLVTRRRLEVAIATFMVAAYLVLPFAILPYVCVPEQIGNPVAYRLVIEGQQSQSSEDSQHKGAVKPPVGALSSQIQANGRADPIENPPEPSHSWGLKFWCETNASDFFVGLFTLLLGIATYFLWRETERLAVGAAEQSEDMKASIAAANRSAAAAEKAIKVTRDIGRSQSRAYVSIQHALLYQEPLGSRITLDIANIGQSPVKWVEIEGNAELAPENATSTQIPINVVGEAAHRWSMDPGKLGKEYPVVMDAAALKKLTGQSHHGRSLVVQGTVRWETVFREIFESTFFFWGVPEPFVTRKTPDGSFEMVPQKLSAPSGVQTITCQRIDRPKPGDQQSNA